MNASSPSDPPRAAVGGPHSAVDAPARARSSTPSAEEATVPLAEALTEERISRQRFWWAIFGLLMAAHAWQCLRCFPTWGALVDVRPIIQVDHALHLYHGSLGSRFLRDHGRTWGYDPFFMAGYPKTPFHDPSAALSDVSQLLAGGGFHPAAYKLGLLFTMLTTPLLFAWGSRLLGLAAPTIVVGTTLLLWYYWSGFARSLLDSGLYGFLWGCAWVVVVLGCAVRWHEAPSVGVWLRLTIATALALFVHPTVPVMLAVPLATFYACVARRHRWPWHLALAAAVAIVLLANAFWIVPMLRLWPLRRTAFTFLVTDPEYYGFVFDFYRARPAPLLLACLGTIGIVRWAVARNGMALSTLGAAIAMLFALTFFGSLWQPTRTLEPLRFQVPLHLYLALAGGEAFVLAARVCRFDGRRRWLAVALVGLGAPMLVWWLIREDVVRQTYHAVVRQRPFPTGLERSMGQLIEWIRSSTDDSARILLEDQLRLLEATLPESLHWTCLLPQYTGRQFIGGQYEVAPLAHHHAAFGDFHLAGRPIEDYSTEQLRSVLRLYNIGWAVCWSPKSQLAFKEYPAAKLVGVLPRFTHKESENRYFLYSIAREHSYFARGAGRVVSVDLDRIELADLRPDGGMITVRYHWLDTFAATPAVPLQRVDLGADPVGFIGIVTDRPIDRLVIENKGW